MLNLACQPILFLSTKRMPVTKLSFDVTHILKDDAFFRQWLEDHPSGFVLNTYPKPSGRYMALHSSQCSLWQTKRPDQKSFTTTYSKVVANDLSNLRAWARHEKHNNGTFTTESCACLRSANLNKKPSLLEDESAWQPDSDADAFTGEATDAREKIIQTIRERRGQERFRNELRNAYGDVCMVTGCQVLSVIEAAHIKPYRGLADHHVNNGLLLRADIHTLYDLNRIAIHPDTLKISIHPTLAGSEYRHLEGQDLQVGNNNRPDINVLGERWKEFEVT